MAIDLYLIRHGLAGEHGSYANDDERPLTEAGKKKTCQVAQKLHDFGLQFDLILTSPLVRARQTAEILMDAGLGAELQESNLLANGPIEPWLTWLQSWQPGQTSQLALVGHEPSLSEWAELLIVGRTVSAIQLKKAGIIGLSLPETGTPLGRSRLFWLTPPRLFIGS